MPINTAKKVTEEDIEKVLKGITIPSPPQVLADLQLELAMPDPDIDEISGIIGKDAGLTGGILKTLSSPFYSIDEDVQSVYKAVLLLGMNTVINIINTLCLRSELVSNKLSKEDMSFLTRFWDSSTDMAMAASLVAEQTRKVSPEKAYLLALFSNVGIALMMERFNDCPAVIMRSYNGEYERVIDAENEAYDTNHAVLGFYTARSWKLPKQLCDVIAIHHNGKSIFTDPDTEDSIENNYLAVLKIAEHLCGFHRSVAGQEIDHEWSAIQDGVLYYLGLSEEDLADLASRVEELGIGSSTYFT